MTNNASVSSAGAAADKVWRGIDPDLSAVIAAWPGLPAALRAGILAMVRGFNP
ncbi:MAG TPA: hypothetical protein VG269_03870 [Tepidisphaeraceae bacterium]|jgi:hypothetical protein|nr:hypothetical protein [Tepidisphaeraceae bacterium]